MSSSLSIGNVNQPRLRPKKERALKEHLMFGLKVALVILVINQVPAIGAIINKNYFGG